MIVYLKKINSSAPSQEITRSIWNPKLIIMFKTAYHWSLS